MRPVIFSDFDGTISQIDVTDLLLTQLAHPSWREVEQEWSRGLIGSRECLERQLALVDTTAKELNALIDSVGIDPHFRKFHQFAGRRKLPFYVVSDGFDLVIRRVLRNFKLDGLFRNGKHLFSSGLKLHGRKLETSFPYSGPPCTHDCATCKAEIIRRLRGEGNRVIFIGDGLSDRFAAQAAHIVFAKQQLLAYCREHQIACWPFETFADIETDLEALLEGSSPKEATTKGAPKLRTRNLKVEVAVGG
jgi:2-hydroxy-3-keto-5-methylthiopentenyl-1-phosphate phosphatase